jgi:hypothetical protein
VKAAAPRRSGVEGDFRRRQIIRPQLAWWRHERSAGQLAAIRASSSSCRG